MAGFQTRLAGLEKDVASLSLVSRRAFETGRDNSNTLLNISLLEEGRSAYKNPRRHTGSSYV